MHPDFFGALARQQLKDRLRQEEFRHRHRHRHRRRRERSSSPDARDSALQRARSSWGAAVVLGGGQRVVAGPTAR